MMHAYFYCQCAHWRFTQSEEVFLWPKIINIFGSLSAAAAAKSQCQMKFFFSRAAGMADSGRGMEVFTPFQTLPLFQVVNCKEKC